PSIAGQRAHVGPKRPSTQSSQALAEPSSAQVIAPVHPTTAGHATQLSPKVPAGHSLQTLSPAVVHVTSPTQPETGVHSVQVSPKVPVKQALQTLSSPVVQDTS